jgi:hypothetical protein
MYVVTKEKSAWADIQWDTLSEEGDPVTESFRMKVKLVPDDDFQAFFRAFAGGETDFDLNAFITDVALSWTEIVGEDKNPFPFTLDNLALITQAPGFKLGWQLSYIKAWHGQGKVREKNSEGLPDDGQAQKAAATK